MSNPFCCRISFIFIKYQTMAGLFLDCLCWIFRFHTFCTRESLFTLIKWPNQLSCSQLLSTIGSFSNANLVTSNIRRRFPSFAVGFSIYLLEHLCVLVNTQLSVHQFRLSLRFFIYRQICFKMLFIHFFISISWYPLQLDVTIKYLRCVFVLDFSHLVQY